MNVKTEHKLIIYTDNYNNNFLIYLKEATCPQTKYLSCLKMVYKNFGSSETGIVNQPQILTKSYQDEIGK